MKWQPWLLWAAAAMAQAADPSQGSSLYLRHCANCHGTAGRSVLPGAPDLANPMALLKPDMALLGTIRTGKGGMPAFAGLLRDREILDVVAHLRTLR